MIHQRRWRYFVPVWGLYALCKDDDVPGKMVSMRDYLIAFFWQSAVASGIIIGIIGLASELAK